MCAVSPHDSLSAHATLTGHAVVAMSAIPPGFTAVKDCKTDGAVVSLLGIVTSLQEPRRSRGTDWTLSFTIQDDFTAGSVGGSSSMGCRVFKPSQASLPKITSTGDVVILRNFKLNPWQGRMDCISNVASGVLVFPASKIPVHELSQAYLLGTQRLMCHATPGAKEASIIEQKAVLNMKHSSSGSAQDVQQHASLVAHKATARHREQLITDLADGRFADIRAVVLNVYYSNHGTVELKVSDYTPNKDLFLYVDPKQEPGLFHKREWPGPYGQVTLEVRLYEPHAAWARANLAQNDFVYLRNVHIRRSLKGFLEGAMHQDRQNLDQVDIRKLQDKTVIEEIRQRQKTYEQQRPEVSLTHLVNAPKKSSAKASAKKKQEKKERLRVQREAEQKELEEKQESWEANRSGVNRNGKASLSRITITLLIITVRAGFPETPQSTISEILNNPHAQARTSTKYNSFKLPFVNCRHRSRVRIVDFYPPELEDFTHSLDDPNWAARSKGQQWDWGFVLLLQDANVPLDTVPEQLRLIVNNDAAQYLGLGNARE